MPLSWNEIKSKGKDLDKAFQQAKDYFPGLKEHELPKYILVSDFERFKLYDLDTSAKHEFTLRELSAHVQAVSWRVLSSCLGFMSSTLRRCSNPRGRKKAVSHLTIYSIKN